MMPGMVDFRVVVGSVRYVRTRFLEQSIALQKGWSGKGDEPQKHRSANIASILITNSKEVRPLDAIQIHRDEASSSYVAHDAFTSRRSVRRLFFIYNLGIRAGRGDVYDRAGRDRAVRDVRYH